MLLSPARSAIFANDVFGYPCSASTSIAASTICARRAISMNVRSFCLSALLLACTSKQYTRVRNLRRLRS